MSSQLCLSTFARSKRGTTVRKSTYTDMILLVGHGVSGDFSSYYSTRGWGRLKTRSPFDTSSSEHSAFDTCLDLFWFPHWFVKILCSWLWFISLTRCWFVLSEEVDLDSTSLVCFGWHPPPLRNAVPREITVTYRDPWMRCILRPKLIALEFRKRTRESMGTLGANHICFRKSLSQTFNMIRLDFSSSIFLLFRRHTTVN